MASTSELIKALIGGPSDFATGWLVILLSSLITIAIAAVAVIQWANSKLSEKRIHIRKTLQLVIGMNIRNFENILGDPIFINQLEGSLAKYKEFLFSNKFFYTQAIINSNQEVVLFSITSRRRDFNPVLQIGSQGEGGPSIALGKTFFSDIGDEPEKTFTHGDHGGVGFYSEIFYFGRPGHYLNYAFSLNSNGVPANFDFHPPSFSGVVDTADDPSEIKRFRSNTRINTFTVISEIETEKISDLILGPRTGQVWNLTQ